MEKVAHDMIEVTDELRENLKNGAELSIPGMNGVLMDKEVLSKLHKKADIMVAPEAIKLFGGIMFTKDELTAIIETFNNDDNVSSEIDVEVSNSIIDKTTKHLKYGIKEGYIK